jgi:uncharacterized protein YjaG (DUF416 family)
VASDETIRTSISSMVEEEHRLREAHVGRGLSDEEKARMAELEVELDRAWDLLRQREARRDAGQSPDDTELRPPGTVESYLG